jgi:hypothetical protein
MTSLLPTRRRTRIALAAAGLLVIGALAAELVLPGIAADRLRGRLDARFGDVRSVEVAATPAIGLLWGDVDAVRIALGDASFARDREGGGGLRRIDHLDLAAESLRTGPLVLGQLDLAKRGRDLDAEFTLERGGGRLEASAAADGTLRLDVDTPLGGTVPLTLSARDGRLHVDGPPRATSLVSRLIPDGNDVRIDSLTAAPGPDGPRVTVLATASG